MQQNESVPAYNSQFDEAYKTHVCKDVEILEIVRPNRIKEETDPYQPKTGSVKSQPFLQQWIVEIAQQYPEKATNLEEMIVDFTAIGLIGEYLPDDFIAGFEAFKEKVLSAATISGSAFIPAYFISHSDRYVDLSAGRFTQPFNFKAMFLDFVQPELLSREVRNVKVEQSTSKEKGIYRYEVTISNPRLSLQMQAPGDRDLMTPFMLMVNRMLIATGLRERFVQVRGARDGGFLFFEPERIVQGLKKYGVEVFAFAV